MPGTAQKNPRPDGAVMGARAGEAVRLHYEQRRSRREIGRALGIGEQGVKSLLRRSRQVLRDCVERSRRQP